MANPDKRAFWQQHHQQWQQSGLTQKAYCQQHELKLANFRYWRSRLQAKGAVSAKLIPLGPRSVEPVLSISAGALRIEIPLAAVDQTLPIVLRCLTGDRS